MRKPPVRPSKQKPRAARTQWISLAPPAEGLTPLTSTLWTPTAAGVPTLTVQHLWIDLGRPTLVSGLRIAPVPPDDTPGAVQRHNYPLEFRLETSRDGGETFETLLAETIAAWDDAKPKEWRFPEHEIENVRVVIPRALRTGFPAYPNVASVEALVRRPAPPAKAAAREAAPLPIQREIISLDTDFARPADRLSVELTPEEVVYSGPSFRIAFSRRFARITHLGWDCHGSGKQAINLLRDHGPAGAFPYLDTGREEFSSYRGGGRLVVAGRELSYEGVRVGPLVWDLRFALRESGFDFRAVCHCDEDLRAVSSAALRFPFDLAKTVTDVLALPDTTGPAGVVQMPAVVHAPDHGSLRITAGDGRAYGRVRSLRPEAQLWFDIMAGARPLRCGLVEHRQGESAIALSCELATVWPYASRNYFAKFIHQNRIMCGLPRGWLNGLAFRPEIGVFANNAVSDAAVCVHHFYADMAAFTPPLAAGLTPRDLLRFSVDQYLHDAPSWGYQQDLFPGVPGSVVDSAWSYVASSQDWKWARDRADRIEVWGERLLQADLNGDGLVESIRHGNGRTYAFGSSWWDGVTSGHQESYVNSLAYRAMTRGAELLSRLGRDEVAGRLQAKAALLRRNFLPTFLNP